MYDLTATDNIIGFVDLFKILDTNTGGLLSPVLMLLIGLVLFVISRQVEEDISKSMVYSGLITTLLGILFVFAGMMSWYIVTFTLILFFAGMIIFSLSK